MSSMYSNTRVGWNVDGWWHCNPQKHHSDAHFWFMRSWCSPQVQYNKTKGGVWGPIKSIRHHRPVDYSNPVHWCWVSHTHISVQHSWRGRWRSLLDVVLCCSSCFYVRVSPCYRLQTDIKSKWTLKIRIILTVVFLFVPFCTKYHIEVLNLTCFIMKRCVHSGKLAVMCGKKVVSSQ